MQNPHRRCRSLATVVTVLVGLAGLVGCSGDPRPDPGPDPDPGPEPTSPYADGWSAVHADAANTDYSPVEGAAPVPHLAGLEVRPVRDRHPHPIHNGHPPPLEHRDQRLQRQPQPLRRRRRT